MERYLRYFFDPVTHGELAKKLSPKQARDIVGRLDHAGLIQHCYDGKWWITLRGRRRWEAYLSCKKG